MNVVFLCRHESGEARIAAPDEVASVEWLPVEAALDQPNMPPWTAEFLTMADERRAALGW